MAPIKKGVLSCLCTQTAEEMQLCELMGQGQNVVSLESSDCLALLFAGWGGAQVDAVLTFHCRGGETLIRSVHPELLLTSSLLVSKEWERM